MHLFSADRPTTASGLPALLHDGNAVPGIYAMPVADGSVELCLMAHVYDAQHAFTYEYRTTRLPADQVGQFFTIYAEDPEHVLAETFHWRVRRPSAAAKPPTIAVPRPPPLDVAAILNLI